MLLTALQHVNACLHVSKANEAPRRRVGTSRPAHASHIPRFLLAAEQPLPRTGTGWAPRHIA